MKSKYGMRLEDGTHLKRKQRSSQTWRGVTWGAEPLRRGLKWMVRNGKSAAFWRDIWLGERPFCDLLHAQVEEEDMEMKVGQFWESNAGWKWELTNHRLPLMIMVELAEFTLRPETTTLDSFAWALGRGGKFTMKDAYVLSTGWSEEPVWEGWRLLWKIKVQESKSSFGSCHTRSF